MDSYSPESSDTAGPSKQKRYSKPLRHPGHADSVDKRNALVTNRRCIHPARVMFHLQSVTQLEQVFFI